MKFAVSLIAITAVATPAFAQNTSLPPAIESVSLNAGFTPDPYTVMVPAGGEIEASNLGISGCVGLISDAPDVSLTYQAGDFPLFLSAVSEADVSIIVNLPNGEWVCDDDSGGNLDPLLSFAEPQSGKYDIWLGSVSTTDLILSELRISEVAPDGGTDFSNNDGGGEGFNPGSEPNFGTVNLVSGFDPDPHMIDVMPGGDLNLASLGGNCIGAATSNPDVRLNFEAGGMPLTIMAVAVSGDVALAINGPDGTWVCEDDTVELDPVIQFENPLSGQYDIYVATVGDSTGEAATLAISEAVSSVNAPRGK